MVQFYHDKDLIVTNSSGACVLIAMALYDPDPGLYPELDVTQTERKEKKERRGLKTQC